MRTDWQTALAVAEGFVRGNVLPVTLRQTFYHLMSRGLIPPTNSAYKYLSETTARLRRDGTFPDFADQTRAIYGASPTLSPEDHLLKAAEAYRMDRTEGQEWNIFVVAEKRGMVPALRQRFGPFDFYILGISGYFSQTVADRLKRIIAEDGRPSVAIYAGDLDASGEDIARDFEHRVGSFDTFHRIAVTPDQVADYNLMETPGKAGDSRAGAFTKKHGRNFQVEVDALDPISLDALYRKAVEPYFDQDTYDEVMDEEAKRRTAAHLYVRQWGAGW